MLVYKALQLVKILPVVSRDWEMKNDDGDGTRKGTSHYCDATVIGEQGDVASIRFKGKTADEATKKAAQYQVGKAAQIPITGIDSNTRGVLVLNA